MGRANFVETIQKHDEGTNLVRTLAGITVDVFLRGTSTPAVIYSDPVTNVEITDQIITADDGMVNFWADAGSYDIAFADAMAPARIEDTLIGWEAAPMAANSIPGSVLTDGSVASAKIINLLLAQLAPEIERQLIPVGQVIEWWRPNNTYPLPAGFEVCDGHAVAGGSHDFNVAGAVTLPDLRNMFVIGADHTKAFQAAGALQDGAASAPGIGRVDGSNRHTLSGNESGVNSNGSTGNATLGLRASDDRSAVDGNTFATGNPASSAFESTGVVMTNPHAHGLTDRSADSSHNNTPRYVGLLKLMKVRQA